MDEKVKSRGRRSLMKRHRGSRLSVPLPAARRQRVELPWGSMFVRPPGGCLANARRRACAVDLERREHARARPAVTAIWTLSEALFLATADQARVDAADGRTAGCDGPRVGSDRTP